MDVDYQIHSLAGETIALQSMFVALCGVVVARDPGVLPLLDAALRYRADEMEDAAIRLGPTASPKHVVHAVRVIEDIRAKLGYKPPKS